MTYEQAAKTVRELARTEHYHRGAHAKYQDIARHVPHLSPGFIANQCELAGFPVWSSVPAEASAASWRAKGGA